MSKRKRKPYNRVVLCWLDPYSEDIGDRTFVRLLWLWKQKSHYESRRKMRVTIEEVP